MVQVIGHRGACGSFPENTLLSFREAIALGADMVELDVHMTSDDEVVVIHDDSVDRTTDGTGKVKDLSLKEIRDLDAGLGERIPTLSETMDLLAGVSRINIELKGKNTASHIHDMTRSADPLRWDPEDILLSSFSPVLIYELVEIGTSCPRAVIVDGIPDGAEDFAKDLGCIAVHPRFEYLQEDFIRNCHDQNLLVNVWTVNRPMDVSKAVSMGVDGIITDFPEVVTKSLSDMSRVNLHE